ncbi:hypothetical protein ACIBFB_03130 [Nocardiopsis sp. NPDC050513]|uniref:hypothetical protein n=1 Tax=Nocardiopsis sp. NPDC050513 TaxID=3364338 RepID=UPI0037B47FE6
MADTPSAVPPPSLVPVPWGRTDPSPSDDGRAPRTRLAGARGTRSAPDGEGAVAPLAEGNGWCT